MHLVEWRSVLGGFGAQCVMTVGIIQMQLLSVENLDLVQKVGHLFVCFQYHNNKQCEVWFHFQEPLL